MPTSRTKQQGATRTLQNLQLLRGVAALMVVLHHSIIQIDGIAANFDWLYIGETGVDIFFVISGVVIYLSMNKPGVTTASFAYDRVTRVVPLYWIFTLAFALLILIAPELMKSAKLTTGNLLHSLFFIPQDSLAFPGHIWPLLVPGWSLNYEMFFYAVCVLALAIAPQYKLHIVCLMLSGLIFFGLIVDFESPVLITYTNLRMVEFLGGVGVGWLYRQGYLAGRHGLWMAAPIGGILLLVSTVSSGIDFLSFHPPFLASILIVFGLVAMEVEGRAGSSRIGMLLGDASYSIYLSHLFTLGILRVLWTKLGMPVDYVAAGLVFFALSLTLSAIVGILVYVLLERPLLLFSRGKFSAADYGRDCLLAITRSMPRR